MGDELHLVPPSYLAVHNDPTTRESMIIQRFMTATTMADFKKDNADPDVSIYALVR